MTAVTTPPPRQRLIDAAADLFYTRGIGAVGVDLVSKTAGVSKRTLYAEFGSKDRLVAESLQAKGPDILGIYLPPADSDEPPRSQILAVFGRVGEFTASPAFRGCPFVNTCTELADPGHPARSVAREYKRRVRDYFADQAARGNASDPRRLADQLAVVFDGAIVAAVADGPPPPGTITSAVEALLDAQGVGKLLLAVTTTLLDARGVGKLLLAVTTTLLENPDEPADQEVHCLTPFALP